MNFFYPLSIFKETTFTALTSYFQHRLVVSGFIDVFQKWWTTFAFTLLSPAILVNDYKSILTSKLQSDSVERRYSRYRQVDHYIVVVSVGILSCRLLIKRHISFWKEGLTAEEDSIEVKKRSLSNAVIKNLDERSHVIMECKLDNVGAEVATRIYH